MQIPLYLAANERIGGTWVKIWKPAEDDRTPQPAAGHGGVDLLGRSGIPGDWLERFELPDVIERVGRDVWPHFGPEDPMILLRMRSQAEVTAVRAG